LTRSLQLHNSLLPQPELFNIDDDSGFLDLKDSNITKAITTPYSVHRTSHLTTVFLPGASGP
jgi:hypothetical protein